jgi:cell division protein FtsQ
MPCSGINIVIKENDKVAFVDSKDLLQSIHDKFGMLKGKPMRSINISLLEKIINTNPFIYNAEVFSTIDGKLNIEVKQRIPVLRVVNFRNESFYIDKEGIFFPMSDKFTARVPVASGYIFHRESEGKVKPEDAFANDSTAKTPVLTQLFNIINHTSHDPFWNAEVQQLYVNPDNDIEFIPSIGNHTVVLGNDEQLDEKFGKLFLFYKQGIKKEGWEKYHTINLKYKNQVVCIKK